MVECRRTGWRALRRPGLRPVRPDDVQGRAVRSLYGHGRGSVSTCSPCAWWATTSPARSPAVPR